MPPVTVEEVVDDEDEDDEVEDEETRLHREREAAENKAREEAQARRLRILNSSKNRLGYVSGLVSSDQITGNNKTTTASAVGGAGDDDEEGGGDNDNNKEDHGDGTAAAVGGGGGGSNDDPGASGGESETSTIPESAPSSKPSGGGGGGGSAARIAAMRRRRFKKTASASTTTAGGSSAAGTTTESAIAAAATMTATAATSGNNGESAGTAAGSNTTTTTAATAEDAISIASENTPVVSNTTNNNNLDFDSTSNNTTSLDADDSFTTTSRGGIQQQQQEGVAGEQPTVKYQGVAKTRRRMLKAKQAAAAKEQEDTGGGTSSTTTRGMNDLPPRPKLSKVHLYSIWMHLLTIMLLFGAGLDIGLQQGSIPYTSSSVLVVHDKMAPRHDGLPFFDMFLNPKQQNSVLSFLTGGGTGGSSSRKTQITKNFGNEMASNDDDVDDSTLDEWERQAEANIVLDVDPDDEFADFATTGNMGSSAKPKGASTSGQAGNVGNIDPLFGVDLDELTSGSGIIMFMARIAVRVHRMFLDLFYYFPIHMYYKILSFVQLPPLLFILALFIRHVVSKSILGYTKLPERGGNDGSGGGNNNDKTKTGSSSYNTTEAQQQKDIIQLAQQMITNMFTKAFPSIVSLYEGWKHLRDDMYIMLCGMFVGMAIIHSNVSIQLILQKILDMISKITDKEGNDTSETDATTAGDASSGGEQQQQQQRVDEL